MKPSPEFKDLRVENDLTIGNRIAFPTITLNEYTPYTALRIMNSAETLYRNLIASIHYFYGLHAWANTVDLRTARNSGAILNFASFGGGPAFINVAYMTNARFAIDYCGDITMLANYEVNKGRQGNMLIPSSVVSDAVEGNTHVDELNDDFGVFYGGSWHTVALTP